MSRLSRTKGDNEERRLRARYAEIYPDCRRGDQSWHGDDTPDLVNCGPWAPECKHRKTISMRPSWEQCEANAQKAGKLPVFHPHWHRWRRLAVTDEDIWFDLIKEAEAAKHLMREVARLRDLLRETLDEMQTRPLCPSETLPRRIRAALGEE